LFKIILSIRNRGKVEINKGNNVSKEQKKIGKIPTYSSKKGGRELKRVKQELQGVALQVYAKEYT
jgi:hypothetical protein